MCKNKKINVLILESIFHLGGAEKITYEIVNQINKERYDIILCTLYHPGPMGEVFINDGYKFHHDLIKSKFDYRAFFKLRKIVIEDKINLIYLLNQPLTLFWGLVIGKTLKIPIVSVMHNTLVTKKKHVKLNIYKYLITFVNRVVAVANIQKDHLVKNEGFPEKLITVIYNGVDVDKFNIFVNKAEKIKSLGMDTSSKTIGIVARMNWDKGVDVFLHTAKLVLQKNKNVQFLIVGEGPDMSVLKKLSAELNIDNKVFFIGARTDIAEILRTFDIAVLSSRTEALPMALLEYMATGLPIVATSVGSIQELIKDRENGFLVQPKNPAALAEKILYLLENKELAQRMGVKARKKVNEKFRLEITVKETEKLFNELTVK